MSKEKKIKDSAKAALYGRIMKYVGVGMTATVVDYAVYSLLIMVLFGGNADFAGVAAIISGIAATLVAYILHSKITWKTRDPGKYGIIKFFAWNALVVIVARPILTTIFGLFGGLYEFAFMITDGINLPFSFDFVQSTGIYILMTAVTMILNYLFYDKIVFGTTKTDEEEGENVDMKGVGESGEKEKSQSKTKNSTPKKRAQK